MTSQRPNQELDTRLDTGDEPRPQGEAPEEGMREMPTDPPAVVPAAASENMVVAAGMGLAGFAKQNPEAGLTGDEDVAWERDPLASDDDAAEPQADER